MKVKTPSPARQEIEKKRMRASDLFEAKYRQRDVRRIIVNEFGGKLSRASASRWWQRYQKGGRAGLMSTVGGKKCRLTPEQRSALRELYASAEKPKPNKAVAK